MKRTVAAFLLICLPMVLFAQTSDSTRRADSLQEFKLKADSSSSSVSAADSTGKTAKAKTAVRHFSGYLISGQVLDMHTSEGLPFATIFFPHSPHGTVADIDGNFTIHIASLPNDTLHFEALGYAPVTKLLNNSVHEYSFKIELERAATTLNEVVIQAKGVDPALLLLRHIIEKKPYNNPDKMDNYKYESYNRLEADFERMTREQFEKIPMFKHYSFIFDNIDTVSESKPFLPVYLTETLSDYYYRSQPKKQREFIKGSMVKGVNNEEVVKYLGSMYQNVNVYRNYIPVFDKKYISPISNDGAFFYKYTIKDTEKVFGHNLILVQFRPRREGDNCFTGDFWVFDTLFALQRISMDVPKTANINWVDRVSLYQEYAPVDTFWFCVKDKFIADFTIYGAQKLPGFIGRKTTTYHNIVVNQPDIDSVLDDPRWKEDIVKSDSAKTKTEDWWLTNRPDTLSKNERTINKMVDTINSMPITEHYKNVMTFLISGVKDVGPIQLGPYFYIYSTNPVEGNRFRISLGTPRKLKDAHIMCYAAYGDHDNKFKFGGNGIWLLNRKPRVYVYANVVHDLSQGIENFEHLHTDNIFVGMVRKPGIPWKQSFSDNQRVEFFKEYFGGFSHTLILQHRQFTPYSPLPSKGIFYDNTGNSTNQVISSNVGIELRYAYKEKYVEGQYLRVNLGSKYPIFNLSFNMGFKNVLNSAYDYQHARFSVKENINIPPFGHLYYNLFLGKYFNTLPYPLLEIHPGNEYYYFDKYSFEMMNSYEFLSDQYAGFNIEHNIGGGIFNHLPALKKLKFRQFWTAKGIIGSLSDANQKLNLNKGFSFRTLEGNPYLELGTGVSNIFQIFRLDLVWRVMPKPQKIESKSRYFGLFISAHFEF